MEFAKHFHDDKMADARANERRNGRKTFKIKQRKAKNFSDPPIWRHIFVLVICDVSCESCLNSNWRSEANFRMFTKFYPSEILTRFSKRNLFWGNFSPPYLPVWMSYRLRSTWITSKKVRNFNFIGIIELSSLKNGTKFPLVFSRRRDVSFIQLHNCILDFNFCMEMFPNNCSFLRYMIRIGF